MTLSEEKALRGQLSNYGKRSTPIALAIFIFDCSIYLLALVGVIYFEGIFLKIACSIVAGTMISALFVVGHDAAHGAFTGHKKLNDAIGRIVLLPALHNFSLWQIAHNKMHHGYPNLKNYNSWSPMTFDEYKALPSWRKFLERLYRTPFGFAPYYMTQRWWKLKFFPWNESKYRTKHLLDFALLISFLAFMVGAVYLGTVSAGHSSMLENFLWIAVVPFVIWNSSMGWTVYIQHTHQKVPWYHNKEEWEKNYESQECTPYIKFPRWFGYIFHDINEHTAHHIAPKIPCYNIYKAQKTVENQLSGRMISEKFSVLSLIKRMKECKLYDFENHRWLNFDGVPTTEPILS